MPVVVPAALTMPQDQENGGANTLHSFSRDKGRRDKDDTPPAPVLAPEPVMARVQTPVVPETSTPAAESEATEEAAAAAEVKAAAEKAAAAAEFRMAYPPWAAQPITVDAAEMAPLSSRLRSAITAVIACGMAVDEMESLSLSMDEMEEMRAENKAGAEKAEELARRVRVLARMEAAEKAREKAAEEAAARRVALEELHAAYTAWSRQPITVDAAEMAPHSSRLRGAIAAAIACGVAVESLSLSMDENEEMRAEYKADMEAWAEDAAAAARAVAPAPAPVPGPEAAGDEVEVMGELTWYERDQKKREEAIELSSDSESE